jgi:hypothetical protein
VIYQRQSICGSHVYLADSPNSYSRGTNENEFDEAVAEKVNQMTKLIMASTADAWLIHLPGMARKHEVFTAEQLTLIDIRKNLDDLVYTMEDRQDVNQVGGKDDSLSLCLFTVPTLDVKASKHLNSLPLLYRKLAKRANARVMLSRPLLVQTRAQRGTLPSVGKSPARKRKFKARTSVKDIVVGKQRQSPLST